MLGNLHKEIAVRFYDNKFYGTTYGKGLYRKALYNGSIDIKSPSIKYLVDFYAYKDWATQVASPAQEEAIDAVVKTADKVYSWLQHYDSSTKEKTIVLGFCTLDLNTNKVEIAIMDDVANISGVWHLEARPCKPINDGRKVPQLLATNADLSAW
jgi:hypothetical protein